MPLTVPETEIDLYNQGFDSPDTLGRKETGQKLSDLVERINDPLVIALNGAWGSGKSHFLERWVGEHIKEEYGRTSQTVYFDAFKHDYLDDPLIALTGAIAERFHDTEEGVKEKDSAKNAKRRAKFKKTAWAVSKAAGRIGLSAVTFGATEILSDMGDEIAKSASDEIKAFLSSESGDEEAEKFWNAHSARIAAMDAFRIALTELTEPKTEGDDIGKPSRKLIIVIDELDRCRPDYALSLLEIIKHFFNVDGVHFVLGVNLKELENSVRARYGSGVDARGYLKRFVSFPFSLPKGSGATAPNSAVLFERMSRNWNIPDNLAKWTAFILRVLKEDEQASLRDISKICLYLSLLPEVREDTESEATICSLLAIFRALLPDLYFAVRDGDSLSPQNFEQLIVPTFSSERDQELNAQFRLLLRSVFGEQQLSQQNAQTWYIVWGRNSSGTIPSDHMQQIITTHMEKFSSEQ
jgi:KAP family P-loop domain